MFRYSFRYLSRALVLLGGFVLLFWATSCRDRSWKKLDPELIREILPELSLLKAYLQKHNIPDSTRSVSYYAFFNKYGVTPRDWDSTMYWYAKNDIALYHNFYSHLDDSIRRLQLRLQKQVTALDKAEKRYSQWEYGRLEGVNLLSDSVYPKLLQAPSLIAESFGYDPKIHFDTTIRLSMDLALSGLSPLQEDSLMMSFALYRQGKIDTIAHKIIREDGFHQLILSAKTDRIDSISGTLVGYVTKSNLLKLIQIDSLSLIRLAKENKDIP